jgi:flagellar hook-associated protein 1 FlgK
MGLSQALNASLSGLRTTQAGLALVASNIANAETPGYTRKTLLQSSTTTGLVGTGVRVEGVNREIDEYVQRQLRVENSGASYASTRAEFYQRLQSLLGTPGSDSALETVLSNFTSALQTLSTSPDSYSARAGVLSAAQALTQTLNSTSNRIQGLRADAEAGLSDAANAANDAMQHIADINRQLGGMNPNDAAAAALKDQRDSYIDQLSQLMDIRVIDSGNNQISVFTTSGVQLAGVTAAHFSFQPLGTLTPNSLYDSDPQKSGVGTLMLTAANGSGVDLIASNAIRSGRIAGLIEMRDQMLPQAQSQLDAIAAAMASSLSDKTTAGTVATSGAQSGFDIDLGGLLPGNTFKVGYTDTLTNTQRSITFVRVDDPSALPLKDTGDPNNRVVGINFSAGMTSVRSQVETALGGYFTVSNPSGNTLRILDDGAGGSIDISAVTATKTATGLGAGSSELPFFVDGPGFYSGAITGQGSQAVGFAARIGVNSALLADPSKLVAYQAGTATGDSTRPDFLYQQLTTSSLRFAPSTGIGTAASPFQGTIGSFLSQVISSQGEAASAADRLSDGQNVVLNALQQRFNDGAGVNIDQEMANLLNLQNAYAANARVLSAVKEMFDLLSKI